SNIGLVVVGLLISAGFLSASFDSRSLGPPGRLLFLTLSGAFALWALITPYVRRWPLYMQVSICSLGVWLVLAKSSIAAVGYSVQANPYWGPIHDLGIALVISGVVSLVFDIAYHRQQFGEHVSRIQSLVQSLGDLLLV